MNNDLVKRLRGYPGKRGMEKPPHVTMDEAADRIEKLETALRSIVANACCDSCREAALVARKALDAE
jgi:hypothetical protein